MKNNVVKNIFSSLIQQFICIICGFIVPRLILLKYGSDVNGLVTSITQFLGYITLLEAGIAPVVKSALYKPIVNKDKKQIEKILKSAEHFFRTIAIVFVLYIVILCIVFPKFYSSEYKIEFTLSLVLIISISTFFEYFFGMTYSIYLQSVQKNYVISILKTLLKLLNTIIVVILVFGNCSIQMVKLASSLIYLISPFFLSFYVKKKYHINLKQVDYKGALKNKWAGFSQHIAAILHNSVDVAVLTFFVNAKEVSVYSVHMLVINSIREISISLSSGIDAWFGKSIANEDNVKLNDNLKKYEFFFYTIITFLFACTLALQIPFIKVYTRGITDANYFRPTFAYIMIFSQYIYVLRVPYNDMILAAGHFKKTKKYAWIEAITNLILSTILVIKYGIIGVATGTLVATLIRTIELMVYASKKILNRKIIVVLKKVAISFLEILCILFICNIIKFTFSTSYFDFLVNASMVAIISLFIILIFDLIFYKEDIKSFINYIKWRKKNE